MILPKLRTLIKEKTEGVLNSSLPEGGIPEFDLSVPPPKVPGELAANVCLMMSKGLGRPPRKLAEEIAKTFPADDLIKKVEVAGPGFLNFWLTDAAFKAELKDLLAGKKALSIDPKKLGKTLFEFVSANPTGPLHVGHGRGAALGDSLVRIYRYLGCDVTAEFYINDAGGQIRNLGLSMEARVSELQGKEAVLPEDGYHGDYVKDLAREALDSKKEFSPVDAKQMIFSEADLAGFASRRILDMIKGTLESFGVHFDSWFSETSLHKKKAVESLFGVLEEKGYVYEQDGAQWFKATEFGDEKDRVLRKANEAPTYFASDIAYHFDKFNRGFARLVNIWGADHHGYAQRIKGALKAIDHNPEDLHIILNQMISIKGGRLSKRAGNAITLQELVDEVGRDAARFFFALRSPGAHFEFDLELAKKQASDNPVYYVQYVHARCCSIFRESKKRGQEADEALWGEASVGAPLEDVEKTVLLHLMSFDKTVEACARDFSNHHLTVYLMDLAGKYHSFYEKCHVLVDDPAVRTFRLKLVDAIRRRVAQGLDLLGVSAPEEL